MKDNIEIKSYGVFEKVSNKKDTYLHAKTPFNKFVLWIFIVLVLLFALANIPLSASPSGKSSFVLNIKRFFTPIAKSNFYAQENLWKISFDFLFYSIRIIFLGTISGALIAFVTAYFSNSLLNSKYVYWPLKTITLILRILPEVIFIYMFKMSFDKNLGMMMTIMWFSWIWLHEYFSRTIESLELNTYFHILRFTSSKLKAFRLEIWPQIRIKIYEYVFYSIETNMRWGSLLNKFGFIGIGGLLNLGAFNLSYLNELMIPLFVFVMFLVILDFGKWIYFKQILKTRNFKNEKTYKRNHSFKYAFAIFIFISILTICILSIILISQDKTYPLKTNNFFRDLFQPNWSILKENPWDDFTAAIELISLTIVTFIIIKFFIFIKMFVENPLLFNKKGVMVVKIIDTIFRNIPIIIYFFFWTPLFNQPQIAFIFAFSIHGILLVAKQMHASMNTVSEEKVKMLLAQRFSKFWIYRNYIWPALKQSRRKIMEFQFEIILRNFATYGIFASSTFGQKLIHNRWNPFENTTPYIWILIGMLIIMKLSLLVWKHSNKIFNSYSWLSHKPVLLSS